MPNTSLSSLVGCLADYDPNAMPVAQAQKILRDFITPIHAVEKVALRSALGRVLATDIVSPINVPAHDNSAMDGYALRGGDIDPGHAFTLKVIGTAYAGRVFDGVVASGECVRIMTGAVMPAHCDTVIAQEMTVDGNNAVNVLNVDNVDNVSAATVTIPAGVLRQGDNRRKMGEDLCAGKAALKKGKICRPADIGLLASLGIAEVAVQRRLRVAFFSTGDELRSIGEALDPGCVYDSNRYTLYGMLTRLGCDIIDMGIVKDQPDAMEAAFRSACENADAVITSGGVSVGAADYTKQIMAQLGEVAFGKIGMRPGRPMAFGNIHSHGKSAYLFGLPGNPVAVMVTFYYFARQALLQMMGADADAQALPLLRVKSAQAIEKKPGRTEYQRGILSRGADGDMQVAITGAQGSGILRSMAEANCMLVLSDEQGAVAAGEMVEVMVFEGLL